MNDKDDMWLPHLKCSSNASTSALDGFSCSVLNDNCALGRGNERIHHGNPTSPGVYILVKDEQSVKQ